MGILKTLTRHEGSSVDLEKYLNDPKSGNERALAMDWNGTVRDPDNWGKEFDEVRKYWGKDSGITLRHFIISPDPEAHVTLKQLRKLAIKWAETNFEDGQWVIVYHDDNENHILHAHVVLNWVRLDGRKWRIDEEKYAAIANDVHSMAREMGLYCGLHDVGRGSNHEIQSWNKKTQAEEALKKRDAWSWKRDIQFAVQQTAPLSKDFEDFKRNLYRKYGIQVRVNTRGGLTYIHPKHQGDNNHNFMCRDYKLGKGYTAEMLERTIHTDAMWVLYDKGELKEGAYDLRVKKATKELEICRPKIWLPKPKTPYDRMYRTSRRTGLANIRAISKAITSIHTIAIDEGMGDNINYKELVEKLETRVKNLEVKAAKAEIKDNEAGEMLANIRRYNRTLSVYEEFKSKGRLTRNRFQKEHSQEIADHEEAAKWLKDNNFHDVVGEVDENPASKTRVQSGIDLDKAKCELREANERLAELKKSGAELYKRQNRPMLRIPHEGGKSLKQERPTPNRLGLDFNAPFHQESTVCHGKRNRNEIDLKKITVTARATVSAEKPTESRKQDVHAMQKSLEEQRSTRIVCALGHERAIDKRIRQEDEDLKEKKKQAEKEGKRKEDVLLEPLEEQNRMMKYGRDPRKWKERGYYDKEKKIVQEQKHTIANVGASARERAATQGNENNQLKQPRQPRIKR